MANYPYIEPTDYFPESVKKKNKIGEYDEEYMKKWNADKEKANKEFRKFVKGEN